jgi:uncharacterized protein YndB with AHSA1/START domain
MEATRTDGLRLQLAVDVPATVAAVFEACTDPRHLPQWWGPRGFTTEVIELDLRVGGRFRFAMHPPDAERFPPRGEYLEIDPPHRLAHTFTWEEPDPDDVETVVTVAFHQRGASTRLLVDQGPFATQARRELHERGWTESLERLRVWRSSA